ncbi:FusB/FusC family EF-G-binding protein [Paenibacillus sp. J5C_2022]|uniref:FusB/FusC family EF-G-binding protein n=1 Tax=Paenibacillus sp. J5C2022 TaxID=2977129 RepID=UPI0021D25E6D|nr:FusB/FusC family EF-G-binding protein [Paenibacillus sp. J5C2022]MCU6713198.1 FusB/FusC family EF-G-binding protein [Paenibacillus sp. J5C2022]
MCDPFIRNFQYNLIKNQADSVIRALRTVSDPKILESVRFGAQTKVTELYPDAADDRRALLEAVSELKTAEDLQKYMQELEPYLIPFPSVTEKQIRRLFPKNKKLKLPDLSQLDFRYVSYLSWIDIATQKMFLVYDDNGQVVGVEGRYTSTRKKSYCFACNRYEELVLFSAVSKKRTAHASPDYYKSVGNYLCVDGHTCNKNITDVASLEKLIGSVLK